MVSKTAYKIREQILIFSKKDACKKTIFTSGHLIVKKWLLLFKFYEIIISYKCNDSEAFVNYLAKDN